MSADTVYLTTAQVLKRYNRTNSVWVYRRVKNDPSFPRPMYIGGMKYFKLSELDAYDASQDRNAPPRTPSYDLDAMADGRARKAAAAEGA